MVCEYCWGQDIPGCEKCDPGWNNIITCPKCQGAGRIKKSGELLTEISNSGTASKNCPDCLDTGFVDSAKNSFIVCDKCEKGKRLSGELEKKFSDLTIEEVFELMIKAVWECKKQDVEASEAEYQKLTGGKVPSTGYTTC